MLLIIRHFIPVQHQSATERKPLAVGSFYKVTPGYVADSLIF